MLEQVSFLANAWFLDGFNPKLNPQLWQEELWQACRERSAAGATFATYTAGEERFAGL